MEMHFSAGVVFIWGWFWGSSWTRGWFDSDVLFSFVSGEVTPNSFTQWERFKNSNVPCMRLSWGEAWALFAAFLLELRQCPCSCGSSPAPKLGSRCSAAESPVWLCKRCWGKKRSGKGNSSGKRLHSPPLLFPLSLPCVTCTHNYLHFRCGINKARFYFCLRRTPLIQICFSLESVWGFTIF